MFAKADHQIRLAELLTVLYAIIMIAVYIGVAIQVIRLKQAHNLLAVESTKCIHKHCAVALYCTALHCTVLHCTVLHCTVLHCTVLHCTVLYYILHSTVIHYATLH